MEMFLIYIVLGLLSGLFGGMIGVGGGFITVPVLYFLFMWKDFSPEHLMRVVVCTSLAAVFVTTMLSTMSHYRKKNIIFPMLSYIAPGIFLGCIIGVFLAQILPSRSIQEGFGVFAIIAGIYFFIPRFSIPHVFHHPNLLLSFFGLIIGNLSSLLGVGGGIFTVPLYFAYGLPPVKISATSSASTALSALIGTIAYLIAGWGKSIAPTTFGYIDILAFVGIGLGCVCTTSWGVKLSHTLPVHVIRRVFGIILAITGAFMLFR